MKRSDHIRAGHNVLPGWKNGELWGQAQWYRDHPKRYTLGVRRALEMLHVCYYEWITAWNNHHHPMHKGQPTAGAFQLIDFVVRDRGILLALIMDNPKSLIRANDKAKRKSKIALLEERNIPYIILPITYSSQEYAIVISSQIRKIRRSR